MSVARSGGPGLVDKRRLRQTCGRGAEPLSLAKLPMGLWVGGTVSPALHFAVSRVNPWIPQEASASGHTVGKFALLGRLWRKSTADLSESKTKGVTSGRGPCPTILLFRSKGFRTLFEKRTSCPSICCSRCSCIGQCHPSRIRGVQAPLSGPGMGSGPKRSTSATSVQALASQGLPPRILESMSESPQTVCR